jgi:hypothetical protein
MIYLLAAYEFQRTGADWRWWTAMTTVLVLHLVAKTIQEGKKRDGKG